MSELENKAAESNDEVAKTPAEEQTQNTEAKVEETPTEEKAETEEKPVEEVVAEVVEESTPEVIEEPTPEVKKAEEEVAFKAEEEEIKAEANIPAEFDWEALEKKQDNYATDERAKLEDIYSNSLNSIV